MKVCSKCSKVSIQENDVVKYGGWYENSKEKNDCIYWIHKNIDCCQTVSNVNYCPNCYNLHQSNISNDNSPREMNNNLRQYKSDDDHISYNYDKDEDNYVARTVIGDSCKTVADKLNKKCLSVLCSPPSNIVLLNSSGNILDDDVEDDNFEMNDDNEQGDQSSANVDTTDIIEQNLFITEKKLLIYVLLTIDTLETSFGDFIILENHMLTDDMNQNYFMNHNGDELRYGEKIRYLFRNAITSIEKKLELCFPINTVDVIDTQDHVAMVLYDYADTFMIKDGICNLKEKTNTSLNNNTNTNVMDLEDMNEDWKKVTLLSFG